MKRIENLSKGDSDKPSQAPKGPRLGGRQSQEPTKGFKRKAVSTLLFLFGSLMFLVEWGCTVREPVGVTRISFEGQSRSTTALLPITYSAEELWVIARGKEPSSGQQPGEVPGSG